MSAVSSSYLDGMKKFWNMDSVFSAMFDRILVTRQIRRMSSEEKYKFWIDFTRKSMDLISKDIPISKDWNILDIGCGIGRVMKEYSSLVKSVTGVDISEKMIDYSKEYLNNNKNCKTYLGNGYDLNIFKDDSFDFIYSYICFQHIRSRKIMDSYISESYRTLKKGGYFKFQVAVYRDGLGKYDEESDVGTGFFGNAYTEEQLKEMVSKFKLVYIEKEKSEFDHYWVLVTK